MRADAGRRARRSGVLYIASSPRIGGGDKVLLDLAVRLDRERFEPYVLTPGPGPVADWAQSNDVPCWIVPDWDRSGRAGLWRRAAILAARIAMSPVRVIHAAAPLAYRAAGLAATITRCARICHLGFPPEPGELEWSFQFGPDAVIACHTSQASELSATIRGIRPACHVVPIVNGVDLSFYAARHDPMSRWRFGGRHVVAIVGHLSDVKGYPAFLEAARHVSGELDGCQFLALGGETIQPGYQSRLEQQAAGLGIADRVHFLGWRRDVPEVLEAADVMVLPSLAEGLPLAVIEAMACGLPVVATDVGGTGEVVVAGETGFLIPPNDPAALANSILRLLRNPDLARQFGQAGRRRVEAHFSLDRVVESVESLYDDLLDPQRPIEKYVNPSARIWSGE